MIVLQDDARQFFSMASAPGEDGKLSYELGMIMKRLWHDHGVQVRPVKLIDEKKIISLICKLISLQLLC